MKRVVPEIFTSENESIKNLESFLKLQQEVSELQVFEAQNISICFLVDVTGSMMPYVNQVRDQINHIIENIYGSKQNNSMEIYLSVVAYRDRDDKQSFETLQFTKNCDEFKQFISQLNFSGGGDQCEDVKIGLQQVTQLEWKQEHLNLLIWIADSPCHGKQFHTVDIGDNYPEDDEEDIKLLLKQISEHLTDIYFYKINETTDTMTKAFREILLVYDKHLKEQKFQEKSFSYNISQNFQTSSQNQAFSQFFRFINKLKSTNQLEQALELKKKIKNYQKLIIDHEELNKSFNDFQEKIDQKIFQDSDIKNFNKIHFTSRNFLSYQFHLKDSNTIAVDPKEKIRLNVSSRIVGQGSFKYVYLAQNDEKGSLFVLKQFKNSTLFDFDNFITEYYIYLISKEIRNNFITELKAKTNKEQQQEIKIFFDDQWIVQDLKTKQYFAMEVFRVGFEKSINNNGRKKDVSQKNEELFQSFLHYSFEYSNYNYILSDIQGFGNILNDISIHSQKIMESFQQTNKQQQLLNQFQKKNEIDMKNFKQNFPIVANLGIIGIVLFFNQHRCNSFCTALKLKTLQQYKDLILEEKKQQQLEQISEQQDLMHVNYQSQERGRDKLRQNSPSQLLKKIIRNTNSSAERKQLLDVVTLKDKDISQIQQIIFQQQNIQQVNSFEVNLNLDGKSASNLAKYVTMCQQLINFLLSLHIQDDIECIPLKDLNHIPNLQNLFLIFQFQQLTETQLKDLYCKLALLQNLTSLSIESSGKSPIFIVELAYNLRKSQKLTCFKLNMDISQEKNLNFINSLNLIYKICTCSQGLEKMNFPGLGIQLGQLTNILFLHLNLAEFVNNNVDLNFTIKDLRQCESLKTLQLLIQIKDLSLLQQGKNLGQIQNLQNLKIDNSNSIEHFGRNFQPYKGINSCKKIKSLEICCVMNKVSSKIGDQTIQEWIASLINYKELQYLDIDLSNNQITNNRVSYLCKFLESNKSLKKLSLNLLNNQVNDKSLQDLFSCLFCYSNLSSLNICANAQSLQDETADENFEYKFLKNVNLKTLYFEFKQYFLFINLLFDIKALFIKRCSQFFDKLYSEFGIGLEQYPNLTSLNLNFESNNTIGKKLKFLGDGISSLKNLSQLKINLNFNNILDQEFSDLISGISKCKTIQSLELLAQQAFLIQYLSNQFYQFINSKNNIEGDTFSIFEDLFKNCNEISSLNLSLRYNIISEVNASKIGYYR
ncbi:hypothetical protein ABPG72_016173 [Tetrahymena utriculariae]